MTSVARVLFCVLVTALCVVGAALPTSGGAAEGDGPSSVTPVYKALVASYPEVAGVAADFERDSAGVTVTRTGAMLATRDRTALRSNLRPGFRQRSPLLAVQTPSRGRPWQTFRFAAGEVRIALDGSVGRDAEPTARFASRLRSVLPGVDAHYFAAPDSIEELLDIDGGRSRSFAWSVDLPAGWRLMPGTAPTVVDGSGNVMLAFDADWAQVRGADTTVEPAVSVRAGRVAVTVPSTSPGTDVLLDPTWSAVGVNNYEWSACESTEPSANCLDATDAELAGWERSVTSGDEQAFASAWDPARGMELRANNGANISAGGSAQWTYAPVEGASVVDIEWERSAVHGVEPTSLACELGRYDGSLTGWVWDAEAVTSLAGPGTEKVGVRIVNTATSAFVVPNASNLCTLVPTDENGVEEQAPTTMGALSVELSDDVDPEVEVSVSSGGGTDDYDSSSSTVLFSAAATDEGSGIASVRSYIDGVFIGSVGASCTPAAAAKSPCPLALDLTGESQPLANLSNGPHTLTVRVDDYTGRFGTDDYDFTWTTTQLDPPTGLVAGPVGAATAGGVRYWSDGASVSGTWTALSSPGVDHYEVRVVEGSEECDGASSVSSWTLATSTTGGTVSSLTLDNGEQYLLCVRGVDTASLAGVIAAKPITVDLDLPVAVSGLDVDPITKDDTTFAATWTAASGADATSGVAEYQVCLSSAGVVLSAVNCDLADWEHQSASSAGGSIDADAPVAHLDAVHVCVRSRDPLDHASAPVCGVTVVNLGTVAPSELVLDGSAARELPGGYFWSSGSSVDASWTAVSGGGIDHHELRVVTASESCVGASSVSAWTTAASSSAGTISGLSLSDGQHYLLCVRAVDSSSVTGEVASREFVSASSASVDAPSIYTPTSTPDQLLFTAMWDEPIPGATTGVAGFQMCLSTLDDACDLADWADFGADATNGTVSTSTSVGDTETVYVCVRAVDYFGRSSDAACGPTTVDTSTVEPPSDILDGSSGPDINWRDSATAEPTITARWTAPSATPDHYAACFTLTDACSDAGSPVDLEPDGLDTEAAAPIASGLYLPGTIIRFCISSVSAAGSRSAETCSDGQVLGGEAPELGGVRDGTASDIEITRDGDSFDANWDAASYDITAIDEYDWELCEVGDCATPLDTGATSSTSVTIPSLTLEENGRYQLCVTAIDLDAVESDRVCSNGVTFTTYVPEVARVDDGLEAEGDLQVVAAGSPITARWMLQPGPAMSVIADWEVCSTAPCGQMGAVSLESGSDWSGYVTASTTSAIVGVRYYVCAMTEGNLTPVCSDGAVGADSTNSALTGTGTTPVSETPTSVRGGIADVDTMFFGDRYTAGWDDPLDSLEGYDGYTAFWAVCRTTCANVVDSGITQQTSLALPAASTPAGDTYLACVVIVDNATGAAVYEVSCSDGAAVELPDGGTVVTGDLDELGQSALLHDVTWTKEGGPYVIRGAVQVGSESNWASYSYDKPVTLTIRPGAVIKFDDDASLTVAANSTLQVSGTALEKVTFTSIHDDAHGGDTDAVSTIPAPADWGSIVLNSPSNVITHAQMSFGRSLRIEGPYNTLRYVELSNNGEEIPSPISGALQLNTNASNTMVENTRIVHNNGMGMDVDGYSSVLLRNSEIVANDGPGYRGYVDDESPQSLLVDNDFIGNGTGFGETCCFQVEVRQVDGDEDGVIPNGTNGIRNNIIGPETKASAQLVEWGVPDAYRISYPSWTDSYWGRAPVQRYCYSATSEDAGPPTFTRISRIKQLPSAGYQVSIIHPSDISSGLVAPLQTPIADGTGAICDDLGIPEAIGDTGVDPLPTDGAKFSPVEHGKVDPGSLGAGPDDDAADGTHDQGDPANSLSGNFTSTRTDLELKTPGRGFSLTRTYNSMEHAVGKFGSGWSTDLDTSLALAGDAATLRRPDGRRLEYRRKPNGAWSGAAGTWSDLAEHSDGFELKSRSGVRTSFSLDGELRGIHDRFGNGFDVIDIPGGDELVRASSGHWARISYDGMLVDEVTLDDGRSTEYTYDGTQLEEVIDVTGGTWEYAWGADGRLACETNPNQHLVFEARYDASGALIRQWDAGRGSCSLTTPTTVNLNAKPTTFIRYTLSGGRRVSVAVDPVGARWTDVYDPAGRLESMTDPTDRCTSYDYDENDNRILEVNGRGLVTERSFDPRGRAASISVSRATSSTSWHCADAVPEPSSTVLTHPFVDETTYNGNGDPTRATRTYAGETEPTSDTRYSYDTGGSLERIEQVGSTGNPSSHCEVGIDLCTDYTRAHNGLPLTVTDPRGHATAYTWTERGLPRTVTRPGRAAVTKVYDAKGFVSRVIEPRTTGLIDFLYSRRFEYDDAGRVTRSSDGRGLGPTYEYDDAGNLRTETDALGRATDYEYNAAEELIEVTSPHSVQATEYDARGLVTAWTNAGERTEYDYDAAGRVIETVLPRGFAPGETASDFAWHYTYDEAGQKSATSGPEGARSETDYDLLGRPLETRRQTDQGSSVTTLGSTRYAYDDVARSVSTTRLPGAATTGGYTSTTTYDEFGRIVSREDERAKIWTYTNDATGNRVREITPEGRIRGWEYSDDNQLEAEISPKGFEDPLNPGESVSDPFDFDPSTYADYRTEYVRDEPSGTVVALAVPSGGTTTYGLDPAGRTTSITNAEDETTRYAYDAIGRIDSVISPAGDVTDLRYGATSNTVATVNPAGRATTFTYDGNNRLTRKAVPSGRAWAYSYYPGGNTRTVTSPSGTATTANPTDGTTTYDWDGLDRPTSIAYSDSATPDVSWTYDDAASSTTMTDVGSETRETDGYGRLDAVERTGYPTVDYEWLEDDLPASVAVTDGDTTSRAYDDDGKLIELSLGSHSTTYGYDLAGNLAQITRPELGSDQVVENRTYDAMDQLATVEAHNGSTPLGDEVFVRDLVGRVKSEIRDGNTHLSYEYDANGRLARECYDPTESCSEEETAVLESRYDKNGNRTYWGFPDPNMGSAEFTYDVDDQLLTYQSLGGPSVEAEYTTDGFMTNPPNQEFLYDQAGQLAASSHSEGDPSPHTYTYSGDGHRIAMDGTKLVQDLATSAIPNVIAEVDVDDPSSDIARSTSFGPVGAETRHTTQTSSDSWRYLGHGGAVNSVESSFSETGGLATNNLFLAFGVNIYYGADEFGFTGELLNSETQTYDLRAREYSPGLGMFTTPDPQERGYAQPFMGTYAYAEGVPTYYTDPMGTSVWTLGSTVVGALGTAIEAGAVATAGAFAGAVVVGGAFGGGIGCHVAGYDVRSCYDALRGDDPYCGNRHSDASRLACSQVRNGTCTVGWNVNVNCSTAGNPNQPVTSCSTGPKSPKNFVPPTNDPQLPPTDIPDGWRVRKMPPTADYPNGYWVLEKPDGTRKNGDTAWQPQDPRTRTPGRGPEDHHVPFPEGHAPASKEIC